MTPPAHATLRLMVASVDPRIADDLRHAFGLLGEDVEIIHAADANEAIAMAAEAPPDAVVAEPRLMGGSGNALLGRFKREQPASVRILLLDDGRDGPALAALENLHRMLYRPLQAETLLAAVRSVAELRQRLENPALAAIIGRIGKLPPPPALSLELMRKTEDPEVSSREVSELVERDPTLAAKVLRLCNSAMYSGGRPIRDIRTAVVWLGNLTLRRLVLAGEIFGGGRMRAEAADRERLRRQSLLASRLAARLLPGAKADLAGTAALLAGVGRLLPDVGLPWVPFEPDAADPERPPPPSYADAGAYLLGLWGLPSILVEAAALHPVPALAGERGLGIVGAVHLAWALLGEVPLDEAWLAAQGLDGELERWRVLAEDVMREPD